MYIFKIACFSLSHSLHVAKNKAAVDTGHLEQLSRLLMLAPGGQNWRTPLPQSSLVIKSCLQSNYSPWGAESAVSCVLRFIRLHVKDHKDR